MGPNDEAQVTERAKDGKHSRRPGWGRRQFLLTSAAFVEIARFRAQPDGSYRLTGSTTRYMKDLASGEVATRLMNPYTGQAVTPQTNRLGGKGYMIYSRAGVQSAWGDAAPSAPVPIQLFLQQLGDQVWIGSDRVYPPGLPQPMGEASVLRARASELNDARLRTVPTGFSSTYVVPWPSWLQRGDRPGHAIWHADGLKLESVEQFAGRVPPPRH